MASLPIEELLSSAIWKNTLNCWIVFIKSEQMNEQFINVYFYLFIEFLLQK